MNDAIWQVIGCIADVFTAVFALLVFLEARKIRQADWMSETNNRWQAFDRLLIEQKLADRWQTILQAGPVAGTLSAQDQRLMLIYLNNMVVEWRAIQHGFYSEAGKEAALAAMRLNIAQLAPHRAQMDTLLRFMGFEKAFRGFCVDALDNSAASSGKS